MDLDIGSQEVTSLNKGHSFWDQTLLYALVENLPQTDRELVIVPGTINTVEEVNEAIKGFAKVLVVITSDEGNTFPIEQLTHPDMLTYMMYPTDKHKFVDRFLPIGYPPLLIPEFTVKNIHPEFTPKKLNWFFAGQINHPARQRLAEVLRNLSSGKLVETAGFSQGLGRRDYAQQMEYASVVPCPGGPLSPDSFRCYEALEMGTIPIPDHPEFWRLLFGEVPFPTIETWDTLPDLINNLKDRPEMNNKCTAWWLRKKCELRWQIKDDLGAPRDDITVLVPTSPIESHPSDEIIYQTINSIRKRLPDSEIILMVDGVRNEQVDRSKDYTEYIRRLLWKCKQWGNVYPLLFEEHAHQANMTREALKHVRTPWILFVEHDTPLTGDIPFDRMVQTENVNLIRFHFEAAVHPEHKHLMLDTEPQLINSVPLLRCAQWSQRPHIATTDFYRRIIEDYFPPSGCTFIEDKMYGILETAWFDRGVAGWQDFKVYMYAPEGDIKRSLNLDGRGSESKYDMRFE